MPRTPSTTPPTASFDPTSVRRVGLVPALHKRRVAAAVRDVSSWFGERGVRAMLPTEQAAALSMPDLSVEPAEMAREADFLLAMGGDGTFLAATRIAAPHGKPVLGVNLGGFGFLASLPQAGMLDALAEAMSGRLRVEQRMMLSARVLRGGEQVGSFIALNDIVVGKGAFARLFRLRTSISGELVSEFPADGAIIATPTGSTGYAVAAGGPVVSPRIRAIIIIPICPHALSARTLVVPADQVVELAVRDIRGEEVDLTADGQQGCQLEAGDRVEVREADFPARVLCPENTSFYQKLRTKLGWVGQR
jgi:NAD+ kinase